MELDRLAKGIGVFATLDPISFPLHHAQMFLEIARKEPCTYAYLQEALGLTHGSVSRSVTALSDVNRKGQRGYQLVKVEKDPDEPRRFLVSLSQKGHAIKRLLQQDI